MADDDPTFSLQGVLWKTRAEKSAVQYVFRSIQVRIHNQVASWQRPAEAPTEEPEPDAGGMPSPWVREACLLYLIFACRMGLSLVNLHRLVEVTLDVAPTQVADAMASTRFVRLGLSNPRIRALLYEENPGTHTSIVNVRDQANRSLFFEGITALYEQILVQQWMRRVAGTPTRLPFQQTVIRLTNQYRDKRQLIRNVHRWHACVTNAAPLRASVDCPALDCVDAARLQDNLPPGVRLQQRAKDDAKVVTVEGARLALELAGRSIIANRFQWAQKTADTLEGPLLREAVHSVLVWAWSASAPPDEDAIRILKQFHVERYGAEHPDPWRVDKEQCLLGVLDVLDTWTAILAAKPEESVGRIRRLLRFMQGFFARPTETEPAVVEMDSITERLQPLPRPRSPAASRGTRR